MTSEDARKGGGAVHKGTYRKNVLVILALSSGRKACVSG